MAVHGCMLATAMLRTNSRWKHYLENGCQGCLRAWRLQLAWYVHVGCFGWHASLHAPLPRIMATRHLRKLQEQLQQQREEPQGSNEDTDSEEEQATSAPAPFNPFDLLTDEEVCQAVRVHDASRRMVHDYV